MLFTIDLISSTPGEPLYQETQAGLIALDTARCDYGPEITPDDCVHHVEGLAQETIYLSELEARHSGRYADRNTVAVKVTYRAAELLRSIEAKRHPLTDRILFVAKVDRAQAMLAWERAEYGDEIRAEHVDPRIDDRQTLDEIAEQLEL